MLEVITILVLEAFGFQALWSPYFFTFILVTTFSYFLFLIKFRSIFHTSDTLTREQGILFIASMILLYIIKGSPIDIMAHLMFYVHMIQMAVLVLIIPPLLILSIPNWVWRGLFRIKVFYGFFTLFTKPLISLVFFNGLFSLYHIPFIFDHVMQNRWLHTGSSLMLFLAAVFMWWPLVNKLPEMQNLSGIQKVGYIFADGILLTPACALIIFAGSPMYATYTDPNAWGEAMKLCVGTSAMVNLKISGPEIFSSMSPLHDQQLGGVLMKVIQEIIYGIVLGYVFFEWYRNDRAESEKEINQQLNSVVIE